MLYLASGAVNAGKLSSKPGLLSIPVCNLVSANHMLVRPPITSAINTQALKFKLTSDIAGYGLCLQKGSGSTSGSFSTLLPVGSRVEIYLSKAVNPTEATDKTYFTATVAKYIGPALGPNQVQFKDIQVHKDLVADLAAASGNYANVLKSITTPVAYNLKMKDVVSGLSVTISDGGFSSYVSPVTYDEEQAGWEIVAALIDATQPGWLPANHTVFANAIKPEGAKYGYNVSKDSVLHQLFPEDVVTAYLLTKDGLGLSDQIVEVNSSGIWWKDSILELPWRTAVISNQEISVIPNVQVDLAEWNAEEKDSLIMPTELHLVYAKLATGGAKLVTSLEAAPNSPITITDPFGNPATSGPLVIKTGMEINEITTTAPGSLVVKNFSGFDMQRGRVVERILPGANIELASSFADGQGEVTINVVGLDGKLEGQPDILAIDDILVEKDATHNLFYSVFPPGKSSSILGKVDVPDYLSENYIALLYMTFIALHSGNSNQQLPSLSLTSISLPALGTKANLSQLTNNPVQTVTPHSSPVASKDCMKVAALLTSNAIPGSNIFFKLTRNAVGGGDGYLSKLGVIAFSYKFIKQP